jgi:hypothetical protein
MSKGVVFKDANTYKGSSGGPYVATNECIDTFNSLLGDRQFDRVAGICSGGEVGLFALLPRVKRQLTLIDHNYGSMYFALLKVMLIKEVGGRRTHELLTPPAYTKAPDELIALIKDLSQKLPKAIRDYPEPEDYYNKKFLSNEKLHVTIRAEWSKRTPEEVEAIENKLDLIEFVHGDLSDLGTRKPFDLLYLSNALEYNGRTGRLKADKLIESCVKPGGFVLSTGGIYTVHESEKILHTEAVKELATIKAQAGLCWNHVLHTFNPAPATVAV